MAALNSVNGGHTTAAYGQLGAFVNQVQAQSDKGLTTSQATQLRKAAQLIQTGLAC